MSGVNGKTCIVMVPEPPGYWHEHVCGKPAKAEREGHPVCGIHARAVRVRMPEDRARPTRRGSDETEVESA